MQELNIQDQSKLIIDQININSITSNQDLFKLDKEGNLEVKTLKTERIELNAVELLDKIYPIGSIYINTIATNPSVLFGGVWEPFAAGKTIIGVDTNDTDFNNAEKTGGSKSMERHNHYIAKDSYGSTEGLSSDGILGYFAVSPNTDLPYSLRNADPGSIANVGNTSYYGTGNSGNLQPYITSYMWKRIA